eukprot:scaffold2262_cov262-Pinguiococcus_pyrenoidosus.AAC.6
MDLLRVPARKVRVARAASNARLKASPCGVLSTISHHWSTYACFKASAPPKRPSCCALRARNRAMVTSPQRPAPLGSSNCG